MGPRFSPLDEQLGLLPGKWSPKLQQIVTLVGTLLPFGQGPALVRLLCGSTLSPSSVRRITEAAGQALVQEAASAAAGTAPPETANASDGRQVSVDGVMVPMVGGVWREAKTLAVGALDPTAPNGTRAWSYWSWIGEADRFAELATGELHRRGVFAAEPVVAVADGAIWCQQFYDYHLPNAIRILDFPHAAEHLSRAAQACFGPGTAADDWAKDQRERLLAGEVDAVCQAVTALPVTQATQPIEAYTVMRKVERYLRERRTQLAYADFQAAGYPIGSGAVESANKRVVEARLKGAGMHWTVAQANGLLDLRSVLCSQRWDGCWGPIVHQRRTARRRTPVAPAAPEAAAPPCPTRTPSLRTRVAKAATPNPYFTDGKPNATHPYKQDYARRYGTTDREASRSNPKT